MIQKLRRKFIATNMLLVSIVLLAVFGVQTFSAYQRAREQVHRANIQTLEWALHSDQAPAFEFVPNLPNGHDGMEGFPRKKDLQHRDFNFVPAFAVEVDPAGKVLSVRAGLNSIVTAENAQALADQVFSRSGSSGSLPGQSLSYLCRWSAGDRLLDAGLTGERQFISFADNSSVSQAVKGQVLVSLAISACALLAFYLISRFLAKVSVQPIEKAWEQQRQFVADASHELKTPLAVILANIDIVESHPEDTVERQSKWIGYIKEEAQRMRALVEDMLFLAKSDAARLPTQPMPVRLDQLVTGSLLPFESVAFESGVTLTDHIAPDLTITGDEGQLRRLVVILLDNAVKYAGEQGAVTVKLEDAGSQVRLSVHNTGPAIPPEHLPHLFERFYRSDTARDRAGGGYGLGLAIAQSIAETHGGRITVESGGGTGTTFTVRLPKK